MGLKGIDVSKWQGVIDWTKVKGSGMVDFAIIRATCGTTYTDPQLAANVQGCEANGIPYGFYHYTYATTVDEAKKEAEHFLSAIKSYKPSYPVFYDIEDPSIQNLGKTVLTDMAIAFGSAVEAAGYYAGIYASKYWFSSVLDYSRLKRFDCWLAQYASAPTWTGNYGIWQYSSTGQVNGISGNVDLNYCYRDYPALTCSLPGHRKATYTLSLTDISRKDEAEELAAKIAAAYGYKNHVIVEVR